MADHIQKRMVHIYFCAKCNWGLRAHWMSQELFFTFADDISGVCLHQGQGGQYEIWLDDQRLWCRKAQGGFPDPKVLKQIVRDALCPDRDLGHVDRGAGES